MTRSPDTTKTPTFVLPERHLEKVLSPQTGDIIYIECDCPLGRNHTFEEWAERFGRTRS